MLALALPATASAALPAGTVTNADWDVRHSWVDYVTNPAWFRRPRPGHRHPHRRRRVADRLRRDQLEIALDRTTSTARASRRASDSTSGGVRTVTAHRRAQFAMSAHSIDVRLTDIRVVKGTSGREHIVLDAYYDPISGRP